MPRSLTATHVHGPFDGDFDPFEEDEDPGVLITFGHGVARRPVSRGGRTNAP